MEFGINQSSALNVKRISELMQNSSDTIKKSAKVANDASGLLNGLRSESGLERAKSIGTIIALCCA